MIGGARAGSGRKRANIDGQRVLKLRAEGVSIKDIAARFKVTAATIQYFLTKHKEENPK
jgi:transposase